MDYIDNPIIESVEGSVEEIVDKKIEEGLKDLDINGNLTPYIAEFSWIDLSSAAARGVGEIILSKEFFEAVEARKTIVIPLYRENQTGIIAAYVFDGTTLSFMAQHPDGTVSFRMRVPSDITEPVAVPATYLNWAETQPKLVSGSNIKTINGQSVLGQGDIDINNCYVLPYTFNEIQYAANHRTTLPVNVDFVAAVNSKKLILVPTGKTVAEGQYISAFNTIGAEPDSSVSISLSIFYGTRTVDIRFSSKSQAPTAANVTFAETPLLMEKMFLNIYNGDNTTVIRSNAEFTVNSIDGASFINDWKTTAMTPNTVYNFVNNGVNRTIAVYDDHRVVITSENNSTVALSPGVTYTSSARIRPSVLPSSLVTKPELREAIQDSQADWVETNQEAAGFIKNRTHYYATYQYPQIGQRFTLAVGPNLPIHSLSDFRVFLNDKFYKFDDSASVGDTMDFGVGEKQMVSITVLDITTSGTTTNYTCQFSGQNGLMPDSYGRVAVQIVRKSKTLDPIYLPDNIVYKDELPHSDWNVRDDTSIGYIANRTHHFGWHTASGVGQRVSVVNAKGTHYVDNYKLLYDGKFYDLPPAKVGSEVNISDYFKIIFYGYSESGNTSTYAFTSQAISETLPSPLFYVCGDFEDRGYKALDEFYLPDGAKPWKSVNATFSTLSEGGNFYVFRDLSKADIANNENVLRNKTIYTIDGITPILIDLTDITSILEFKIKAMGPHNIVFEGTNYIWENGEKPSPSDGDEVIYSFLMVEGKIYASAKVYKGVK